MKSKSALIDIVLFCVAVILTGAASLAVGFLSGGDLFDTMAGGTPENSTLQNSLLYGGAITALVGLALLLICLLFVVGHFAYRAFSKQ